MKCGGTEGGERLVGLIGSSMREFPFGDRRGKISDEIKGYGGHVLRYGGLQRLVLKETVQGKKLPKVEHNYTT